MRFYNSHAAEQSDLSGDLAAAYSKLEEVAPRLALAIHQIRKAFAPALDKIDADTMEGAIRLTEWFKHESRRVYSILDESEDEKGQRDLLE